MITRAQRREFRELFATLANDADPIVAAVASNMRDGINTTNAQLLALRTLALNQGASQANRLRAIDALVHIFILNS